MDIRECERRVLEWASFVTGGPCRGRCGSVEGRYIAPRCDEVGAAAKAQIPIDIDAAEQVERLMHTSVLESARRLLKALYIEQQSKSFVARKCSMSIETIEQMRQRALMHVGQRIDFDNEPVHVIRRGKPIWAGVAPAKQRGYIPRQLQTTCQTNSPAIAGAVVGKNKKEPA